jgi:2-polyprenyl-6-methoxyphenol hydroxylase-like FAD-dependent oxidoreductase
MGLLSMLEAARTRNDRSIMIAPGREPLQIDLGRLGMELADRHVEIMRGELASILYETGRERTEYIFGDSIARLEQYAGGVHVAFESGHARDFALVIGADGQHSNVRRLAFGPEEKFAHYIGGYICGCTIANVFGFEDIIYRYVAEGRTVAIFPIRQSGELGVLFLFRRREPLHLDHDDIDCQKDLVREVFGEDGWEVPRLLDSLDQAQFFYFDSFSQIRMESWTTGRIALVGDAGYGSAPGVGGGTSLAVLGAYLLAGELAVAGADPAQGLSKYEDSLRDVVAASRHIGPAIMRSLLPATDFAIGASFRLAPVLMALPAALRRWFPTLPRKATRSLRVIADAPIREYTGLDRKINVFQPLDRKGNY